MAKRAGPPNGQAAQWTLRTVGGGAQDVASLARTRIAIGTRMGAGLARVRVKLGLAIR